MHGLNRRRFLKGAGTAGVAGLTGLSGCTGSLGGGGTTTIKFWHAMGGDTAKLLDNMGSDFESQTEGIELDVASKGSYRETLNATTSAVKAGNPPAVSQIFEVGTQLAIDSGAFVPVEEIIPSDRIDYDQYLDSVMNYYRIDGTLNSMPFNSSNPVLYYNKDAFEAAGLDPESPPKTFEEVRAASEALVANADVEKGITFANHSWFVEQWFAEQDALLVGKQNGRAGTPTKANLTSDASRNIFEWWADMYDEGYYLNPGVEAWSAADQAFLSGKTGMHITSTSGITSLTTGGKENGFEVGVDYLPVPNGSRNGVVIGGASLWVPSGLSDAQQEAAAEFLLWLTQPEQQVRWHKGTGYFPIHSGAVDTLENDGWFDENPNYVTAFEQLQETKDSPATRGAVMGPFLKTRTIIEEGYVSMIQGTPVDDALSNMDSKVESELEAHAEKTN
ncbi:carbohydrate ABC transporter substrate-binding protein, CUT1 family [Haloferax elongans ATCC BAA-1513]|uniref:Carbohydrate ABC transporter substrate-binding protein, CUT1 family n=1 Tax=Haloferax elongans ATCC BAA-1513 TaxID=1230453 RepID=M0HD43_HALEO|nr:extracellular solute-binding protein [Haloferax elongans]ELZ82456.1 carbohydrate ABC transporter substrate-binding protein, CUT1 family [Haloferax elongans ATCC BAA-1513]